MKRSSMGKEIMPPGKRKGPPPKRGPMPQGVPDGMRRSSGMATPAAMSEMPMGMKKGGMAKKTKPKMTKGGMMLVIGLGKPKSMKKGK